MILQDVLILGIILILAGIAFVVARQISERVLARRSSSLAVQLDRDATAPWPDRNQLVPSAPHTSDKVVDKTLDGMVQDAGLGINTNQVLWLCLLSGFALAAGLYFWYEEEWIGAIGLLLGVAVPLLILAYFQRRHRLALLNQLPDAFFFLARSLRAGLPIEEGVTRAGDQLDEPLAGEFRRAAGQMHLGLHPVRALQNMADRVRLPDFNIFVSTVGLSYQSGGNLALLLDRLAAATRDRIQFLGYFRAATALGRTAGIILGLAMPVLVIAYAVLEPDFAADLFRTPEGLQLLAVAAVLEVIGIIWCIYLLRVDY
jgi:tight adherence protein B